MDIRKSPHCEEQVTEQREKQQGRRNGHIKDTTLWCKSSKLSQVLHLKHQGGLVKKKKKDKKRSFEVNKSKVKIMSIEK